MRVADLIVLLQAFQEGNGPDAQIAVPRSGYQREEAQGFSSEEPAFGEEVFLYHGSIATYLDSRGPEVGW